MAGLINVNQVGAITAPTNGTSPIDADEVTANDNALRTGHNAHESDSTVHVQSSLLSARPAASVAQRKWISTDGLRVYIDNGSSWDEIAYARLAVANTFTAAITVPYITSYATSGGQATFGYDSSNRFDITVSSAGAVTFNAVGASAGFTFADGVTISTGGITVTGNSTITGTLTGVSSLVTSLNTIVLNDGQGINFGGLGAWLGSTSGKTVTIGSTDQCLVTTLSSTTIAGLRIPHGAAPTSPVNGDIWTTTAGLFVRINGVTKTVTLT